LKHSVDKLRHTRSVAYSAEFVLLNEHQISGGGAYLHCYQVHHQAVSTTAMKHMVINELTTVYLSCDYFTVL